MRQAFVGPTRHASAERTERSAKQAKGCPTPCRTTSCIFKCNCSDATHICNPTRAAWPPALQHTFKTLLKTNENEYFQCRRSGEQACLGASLQEMHKGRWRLQMSEALFECNTLIFVHMTLPISTCNVTLLRNMFLFRALANDSCGNFHRGF